MKLETVIRDIFGTCSRPPLRSRFNADEHLLGRPALVYRRQPSVEAVFYRSQTTAAAACARLHEDNLSMLAVWARWPAGSGLVRRQFPLWCPFPGRQGQLCPRRVGQHMQGRGVLSLVLTVVRRTAVSAHRMCISLALRCASGNGYVPQNQRGVARSCPPD